MRSQISFSNDKSTDDYRGSISITKDYEYEQNTSYQYGYVYHICH
ncbi:hypothetical protein A4W95_00859 [Treponema pallidum subsp. pallidum]|nr:hypothetical protein A4W95_00859 [Treponema pallidum subsp. pallidum]